MQAAVDFLLNPQEIAPCHLCRCSEDGHRSSPITFRGEPLSLCLRKHLPAWSLELAQAVLLFHHRDMMPLGGGWMEQPAIFISALDRLGWSPEATSNG